MRYVIALVLALGIAAAIYWFTRSKPTPPPKPAVGTASAATTTPVTPPAPITKIDRVRQLDATARKQLREQIALARTRSRAAAEPTKSSSPAEDPVIPLEEGGPTVDALKETPALLARCYGDQDENFRALARMTIISDPDLGAVIDTDAIVDKDGKPLDAKIEACMRDTFDSLALPPMAKPGKLKVEYTFRN